jgi:hypothetical protein
MSGLLTLARDYIERMANPVYGFATNEDYSLRFAKLLATEGFEGSLRDEIQGLRDKEALTSNGWRWLIGWARSRRIELPEELLVELFEEWSSVSARCSIVDLATYRAQVEPKANVRLRDFPNQFLASIMRGATEIGEDHPRGDDRPGQEPWRLTGRAESVLVVFLQVGTPLTLGAASALLRHQWPGHEQLFEFLRVLATTLDSETRRVWSERLDLELSQG